MIEKSATKRAARSRGGLLDLNRTNSIDSCSALQIAKFVQHLPHMATNLAIRALDPRGRCSRKGLLLAAGVLLALQVVVALALWGAGLDLASPLLLPLDVAFCWVAFALISKRLHDLGRSAWWIPAAVLIWLVAIICLAGAIVLSGDPDMLAPGTTSYWITFAAMLMPLLVAAIWLHSTAGNEGSNRFGPEPTSHGFSMPVDAAAFWQRTPTAGRA
jgi:uncharacterized membrane protein YhaH (DUF805 family)